MTTKARILVVGMGGVGTMAAYALEKGGLATVTAVARSTYSTITALGIDIVSVDHGTISSWRPSSTRPTVPPARHAEPFDFIVVATKNIPDVPPSLISVIAPAVTKDHTSIVLLQNGLNIEHPFMKAFPGAVIISGISMIGAAIGSRGTVSHDVHDELVIGPFAGLQDAEKAMSAAQRFVDLYSACGAVTCTLDSRTSYHRWRKLIYNASFNSVAAITGLDVSRMRFSEHVIDSLVRPIMLEIVAIAAADGIQLEDALVDRMIVVDPYAAFFLPSMGQDAVSGNYIEFENIVGEPLRTAQRLGVAVPTLEVVYALLKAKQWQILERKGQVSVPQDGVPGMKYA